MKRRTDSASRAGFRPGDTPLSMIWRQCPGDTRGEPSSWCQELRWGKTIGADFGVDFSLVWFGLERRDPALCTSPPRPLGGPAARPASFTHTCFHPDPYKSPNNCPHMEGGRFWESATGTLIPLKQRLGGQGGTRSHWEAHLGGLNARAVPDVHLSKCTTTEALIL